MNDKRPKAPSHLSAEAVAWWDSVNSEFALDDHHLRLLQLSAEAWDICQRARREVAEAGLTFLDRFGQLRAHPSVAIERDARTSFARLLRELALDVSEPDETPRPPAIGGNAGRQR